MMEPDITHRISNFISKELKEQNRQFQINVKSNPVVILPNRKAVKIFEKCEIQSATPFIIYGQDIYERKKKRAFNSQQREEYDQAKHEGFSNSHKAKTIKTN